MADPKNKKGKVFGKKKKAPKKVDPNQGQKGPDGRDLKVY